MKLFSRAREVLRDESPRVCLGLLARKLSFDLLNVFHFFESDLQQPFPHRKSFQGDIRLYRGPECLEQVETLLRSSRLSPSILGERLARGDLLGVTVLSEQAIAYTWMNLSGQHWASDLGVMICFGPGEVLQYDSYVFPAWRGLGLQFQTTVPVMEYAAQHGYRRSLAYVNGLNTRSLRNQRSQVKKHISTIWTLRLPGTQGVCNLLRGDLKPVWAGAGRAFAVATPQAVMLAGDNRGRKTRIADCHLIFTRGRKPGRITPSTDNADGFRWAGKNAASTFPPGCSRGD